MNENNDGVASSNPYAVVNDEIAGLGRQAWLDKRDDQTWEGWDCIGLALRECRRVAMLRAGVNHPNGGKYSKAMAEVCEETGFGELYTKDKTACKFLLDCMERREDITKWRKMLTLAEQLKWNHPRTVLSHFESAMNPKPRQPKEQRDVNASKVQAEVLEENTRLQDRLHAVCEQLDRERRVKGVWDATMTDDEIVDNVFWQFSDKLPPERANRVAAVMAKRLATVEQRERAAERQTAAEHRAVAECQTPSAPAAEPSEEAPAEPPPASAPTQEPPTAPNAMTPASPQGSSWKPKPGRPKIGARKLVGAYRHLTKGPIHCDPDDVRAEGWAVLEYCYREDGVKTEWLVVEEFASRERAQQYFTTSEPVSA